MTDAYRSKVCSSVFGLNVFVEIAAMGCPHNLLNGRGPKVNTAKHSSEKGEDGTHPPLSHYCA